MPAKLITLLWLLLGPAVATSAAPDFVGSERCANCHAQEHKAWQGSHHDLAMQVASPETVLGDFDNASFTYNGIVSTFSRRGDDYFVTTDGEDGKLTEFPVPFVFGVYPLQQYLLPLSRGRLQALSITWDARPKDEGGQRWYHLYPDEPIFAGDPLHWTGPYQNWNTRCAECHSTDLQKNYDARTRTFSTTYEEVNVGCESCHGPGSKHTDLAATGKLLGGKDSGFQTALAQRGEWAFPDGENIAKRQTPLQSNAQIDNCARCHARRSSLGDYHYGADLLDTHRLSLLRSPLYYHDGQIQDEVYVYGSFIQSKMHMAGVVCSNCHEPHTAEIRAPGNAICAQCHKPDVYDSPEHHHHSADSTGAQCANCHMPETTYMGVDPRRDHSMRIPRPDLSVVMGTPNACNQCHLDKDADWSLSALREWGVQFRDTGQHPARAFALADAGDVRVLPQLTAIAQDTKAPPVWRATAIESVSDSGGNREILQLASQFLYDDNAMIRTSTVNSMESLPLNQRYQLLRPLIDDDVTSVRLAVANSLAGVPLDQIPETEAAALVALFKEFQSVHRLHADMPSVQMQLGLFYYNRGDLPASEAAYREALVLNPQLIPAYLNLADLLRTANREDEARQQLLAALAVAPESGDTLHSLGLLETRGGNSEKALDYLGRAAAIEQNGTRHRFVYAIALHDLGQPEKAVGELEKLLRQVPGNQEVLLALVNYNAELGRRDPAVRYARQLLQLSPNNQNYQQLLQQVSTN
ncbi:MAG: tetratricopeptide repeat protein [Halieaceae bacterium]